MALNDLLMAEEEPQKGRRAKKLALMRKAFDRVESRAHSGRAAQQVIIQA
jgi:hypothetical protein